MKHQSLITKNVIIYPLAIHPGHVHIYQNTNITVNTHHIVFYIFNIQGYFLIDPSVCNYVYNFIKIESDNLSIVTEY